MGQPVPHLRFRRRDLYWIAILAVCFALYCSQYLFLPHFRTAAERRLNLSLTSVGMGFPNSATVSTSENFGNDRFFEIEMPISGIIDYAKWFRENHPADTPEYFRPDEWYTGHSPPQWWTPNALPQVQRLLAVTKGGGYVQGIFWYYSPLSDHVYIESFYATRSD
jgi:hypothetical protein